VQRVAKAKSVATSVQDLCSARRSAHVTARVLNVDLNALVEIAPLAAKETSAAMNVLVAIRNNSAVWAAKVWSVATTVKALSAPENATVIVAAATAVVRKVVKAIALTSARAGNAVSNALVPCAPPNALVTAVLIVARASMRMWAPAVRNAKV